MKKKIYNLGFGGLLTASLFAWQLQAQAQGLAYERASQSAPIRSSKTSTLQVREALHTLRVHYNVDILFSDQVVRDQAVPTNALNLRLPLEQNLEAVLRPFDLRFKKSGSGAYLITPAVKQEKQARPEAAVRTGEEGQEQVQTARTISGRVTDEKGEALPGVTVLLKGTATGTATGGDGQFSLSVPEGGGKLVFSFIGYQAQEVSVGSQSTVNVTLAVDAKALEEVVVIGYGTVKKSDLTGSVSSVSSEDFNQGPQLAAQQLIQGKVAGVNISKNSGKPGGSNTVRIRGGTSITASNEPLYVIDGVPISTTSGVSQSNISTSNTNFFDQEPVNPLMTLNPNDIESIVVLKDASATAIYGSRGANGVIMITTKRGRQGIAQVTYDVSAGVSQVANTLDVLSADRYREVINGLGLPIDDKGANTNWQDEIFRVAYQHNHYLSLSGGTEQTTYRASVGYGKQQGIMLGSDLRQTNARININHSALDNKLVFDLRLNYGDNKSSQSPVSNTVGSELGSSLNYESYVFNPTYPVRNENGQFFHVPPFRINPVSFSSDLADERENRRFISSFSATYKIVEPLSFKVNLGYTRQNIDRNSFISKNNPLGEGLGGYASVQKLVDYSKLLETTFNYNKSFGSHAVDAVAGYSYQYFRDEGLHNTANGFLSDEFKWYSLQAASTISQVSSFFGSNKLISFYGRVNYNYDNRYFLTGTIRRDGSSRFGSGNKWGLFPSAAAAWRISEEDFFDVSPVSDLKLRASYGVTGNQEIGNLNSITTLGASTVGYIVGGQRITMVLPQQYANPDLQWEQTAQFDAGLSFGLLDHRIYGDIDYYNKKTSDLLLQIAVPSPSVISTQLANVGSIENKGLELELGAEIIRGKDFQWTANVNYSRNRNKVLSLSNEQWQGEDIKTAPVQGQGLSGLYAQLITPGQPIGTFYGKKFIGIENGVEQFEEEDQVIGSAQPDFTYGVSNTFKYRGWDLGINLRGSVGNDVYNMTANNLGYMSNLPGRNVFEVAVESGVGRDQPKQYSSRWIEDGSFLRLDNLSLAYTFHTDNTFLSNARVYLLGQNLFVLTDYSGLDPEVNSDVSGGGVAPLGIDYLSFPRAKTVSIGATISF